jgi:hypothetical protein
VGEGLAIFGQALTEAEQTTEQWERTPGSTLPEAFPGLGSRLCRPHIRLGRIFGVDIGLHYS